MTEKADAEKHRRNRERTTQENRRLQQESERQQKLNEREAARQEMRKDLQKKRKQWKKDDVPVEVVGMKQHDEAVAASETMKSSADYFKDHEVAITKEPKVGKQVPVQDPFKQHARRHDEEVLEEMKISSDIEKITASDDFEAQAQKYDGRGWGRRVTEKEPALEEGRGKELHRIVDKDVEILVSGKDKAKIEQRKQMLAKAEDEERARQKNMAVWQRDERLMEMQRDAVTEQRRIQELEQNLLEYEHYKKRMEELLDAGPETEADSMELRPDAMPPAQDARPAGDFGEAENLLEPYDDYDDEQIGLDQLMHDAAAQQAVREEDREDVGFEDLDEGEVEYTYTVSQPLAAADDAINQDTMKMWDYVIERHGRSQFEAVYAVVKRHADQRFDDRGQKMIAAEVSAALTPMGIAEFEKQEELVELVSSFMMVEEFKMKR
jgi:hypothetical protein